MVNSTILTDPENWVGKVRFNAQYVRCGINPSDHYVFSLTNTTQYRITTDGAGFDIVYFTGDWIKNGCNAPALECCVSAGMQTSRAISGYPRNICDNDIL